MMISVRRTKTGTGLTLESRAGQESGTADYNQAIHRGESALGFTYEEWHAALGPRRAGRVEVTEDGALRPMDDVGGEGPADGTNP